MKISANSHQSSKGFSEPKTDQFFVFPKIENVVKTTIFLSSMDNFKSVNEIYGSYLKDETAPARETVEVSKLPVGVNVEISMIAIL